MAEDDFVALKRLRWRVRLARRQQWAESAGTGIDERIKALAEICADVQPVGALTFWGSEQTETPITHRIFTRWIDYLDQTYVVIRISKRPDQIWRTELFRVRRVKELGGRKRFICIEAELEKTEVFPC